MSHCNIIDKGCDKISSFNISLETRTQDYFKDKIVKLQIREVTRLLPVKTHSVNNY